MIRIGFMLLLAFSLWLPAQAQDETRATSGAPASPIPVAGTAVSPQESAAPPPGLPLLPNLPAVERQAFDDVRNNAAPLTPERIRQLKQLLDDVERATSSPVRTPPAPVSTAVTANLMPGAQPPVVRLAEGYVTNILFVDPLGAPLAITGADAIRGLFEMPAIEPGSNLIKVSPKSRYATGNLSVSLKGVTTPVTLTLVSNQREVDYRVDVRVTGGAVARTTNSSGARTSVGDETMLQFLSGVVPHGARPLQTDTPDVQVWAFNNRYYVRSPLTLLSPAYVNPARSADGTTFYEIPPTAVLVVSASGTPRQVRVQE